MSDIATTTQSTASVGDIIVVGRYVLQVERASYYVRIDKLAEAGREHTDKSNIRPIWHEVVGYPVPTPVLVVARDTEAGAASYAVDGDLFIHHPPRQMITLCGGSAQTKWCISDAVTGMRVSPFRELPYSRVLSEDYSKTRAFAIERLYKDLRLFGKAMVDDITRKAVEYISEFGLSPRCTKWRHG